MATQVTIVGAGLSGLMLARILQIHDIPVVVYEAEASPSARAQGGMLDIHDHNGQKALQAAGLIDAFRSLVLEGRQAMRILDRDGTVLFEQADDGTGGRPEVQRGELRQLLLESLPAGTVRWDRKVRSVQATGQGAHELIFNDGSAAVTSLLIGADGAWSQVRPLLSNATPEYTGTSFVETRLFDADTRHPACAETVGGGAMGAPATGKAIMAHHEKGGTLHVYVMLTRPQDWFAAIDFADAASASARIAREFDGWAPELTGLITLSDTAPVFRPLYALPLGHRWERKPGVTLLGDAAHLSAPDGEGANLAMYDGAELGRLLAAYPDDVEAAISEYERAMFTRSAEVAMEGAGFYKMLAGETPAHDMVKMFTGARDHRE